MTEPPNRPPPPRHDRPGVEGGEHDVAADVQPAADAPAPAEPEREGGMVGEGEATSGSRGGGREGGMIGEG
jgi:hypothetical protein